MTEKNTIHDSSEPHFFYPHGGLMVWMFIVLELLVFGLFIGVFFFRQRDLLSSFSESRVHLDQTLATINTLVLITSGYVLALASRNYEKLSRRMISGLTLFSGALGVVFLFIKYTEYKEKLQSGFGFGSNTFFDLYWVLTGFHMAHVVVGVFILFYFSYKILLNKSGRQRDLNFDTATSYWHMCDLIWILIFPIIYLF